MRDIMRDEGPELETPNYKCNDELLHISKVDMGKMKRIALVFL
jgi:hypothetical protein